MKRCYALFLFAFLTPLLFAKGDIQRGEALSAVCATCHGNDGNSLSPVWPKIAGQNESYLYKQLLEFKKGPQGKRNNPIMSSNVANLTDENLEDLAAYFASKKTAEGETQANLKKMGEAIYRAGIPEKGVAACIACHGPDGLGNFAAGYPKVSGQHAEYSAQQLKTFADGSRANDPNAIMRTIAKKLNDDEINAVSSYMSGLR